MTTDTQDLETLKQRADMLGVVYPSKVTASALRLLINEHRDKLENVVATPANSAINTVAEQRKQVRDDAMKLIRIRITNMNPKKKDLKGELITVANEIIGTVTKFIPFDPEFSINGYHVPNCIYENLKERKFLNVRSTKDRVTGRTKTTETWANEYALEVLPQLTAKELSDLAKVQQASGAVDQVNTV